MSVGISWIWMWIINAEGTVYFVFSMVILSIWRAFCFSWYIRKRTTKFASIGYRNRMFGRRKNWAQWERKNIICLWILNGIFFSFTNCFCFCFWKWYHLKLWINNISKFSEGSIQFLEENLQMFKLKMEVIYIYNEIYLAVSIIWLLWQEEKVCKSSCWLIRALAW